MPIITCVDCNDLTLSGTHRCNRCQKKIKKSKCEHPDDEITGRWEYVDRKLTSASGYCMICGESFKFCVVADKMVPKKNVKQQLGRE